MPVAEPRVKNPAARSGVLPRKKSDGVDNPVPRLPLIPANLLIPVLGIKELARSHQQADGFLFPSSLFRESRTLLLPVSKQGILDFSHKAEVVYQYWL